ncbi:MAG: peptidoglycan-binding protein [Eubacteriales bacterium]|jgi:hypothetical protein
MSFTVAQAKANMHGMYGNYNGAINNAKDAAYRNAVYAFRARKGLPPSRYFNDACISASIAEVKELQTLLTRAGFSVGASGIDGRFGLTDGGDTGAAVAAYQASRGLRVDKVAGTQTMGALRAGQAAGSKRATPISAMQTGANIDFAKYPNFRIEEFACRGGWCCDGSLYLLKEEIVAVAQRIRSHFGRPLIITKIGGIRCQALNRVTYGAVANSKHTQGKAIDFYMNGVSIQNILAYCAELKRQGIIRYYYTNNSNMRGCVHVEVE